MPNAEFNSVDDYIASQPEAARTALAHVRSAIRKAVPGLEEAISYHMPTYKLNGQRVLYFAAWKDHYSIYGATRGVVAAFSAELARYKIEKGTIRLPLSQIVPIDLIGRIARFRADEVTTARPRSVRKPRAAARRPAGDTP
jgi:uncharacterized protein YdhG (YjbR/CyaY superfamily)